MYVVILLDDFDIFFSLRIMWWNNRCLKVMLFSVNIYYKVLFREVILVF